MATRAYNAETRRRQQAERKSRIAAATAGLHAAKGVVGTSYADIAAQAGVSLPTVYSHFPTQNELLQGCTAHVAARAPEMPVREILAAPSLAAAAGLLVDAMEGQHLHFEPWMAKREDGVIPFLAEMSASIRRQRTVVVAKLLERYLGPGERREMVAGWESLLSFDLWHRLVRGHRLSRAAARHVLVQCLLTTAGAGSTTGSTAKPKSRKRRNSP